MINPWVKRIIVAVGMVTLLLVLSVVIVLNYFEEDVVQFAKTKSQEYFTSEFDFESAELSFWKTFPNASLHVEDVYIQETFATGDTLFYAQSVFLEFGLLDLFRGNYTIRAIRADQALGRLKVDEKGNDNWHFWKSKESSGDEFELDLKKIRLNDTRFTLNHLPNELYIQLSADKAEGKGNFHNAQFELNVNLEGILHELTSHKETYAVQKRMTLSGKLDADTDQSSYRFLQNKLTIERMPFHVDGVVNTSDESFIDLSIKGDDLSLQEVMESLSPRQQTMLSDYKASGKLNAVIQIKGKTHGKHVPVADMHFTMNEGVVRHKPSSISWNELVCDFRYVIGAKEDVLSIRTIQARMPTGYVDVQGIVKNLKKPLLDVSLVLDTDLDNLRQFFEWDTLQVCKGKITANAHITGELNYIPQDSMYNWKALNTKGNAQLKEAQLQLKQSNRIFSNMYADIVFDNKNVQVNNFNGWVNGSDFAIQGSVKNLIPFLTTSTEHLYLDASLYAKQIDFTNLVEASESQTSTGEYYFELPERIDFTLQSDIKKFRFRNFEATDIHGVLNLDGLKLSIAPVAFRTAEGAFDAQLTLNEANDGMYRLVCLANLSNINIQKLFGEFENFGQQFITDKHLRGYTHAKVQFNSTVTKSLKILPNKVVSLIDISIENGQLIGLESLQSLATYIKKNKLSAPFVDADRFAEKLKDIRFSRMENTIEIKNSTITIPAMDIKSSALDISARGSHTFDNAINYTIGFYLRDVLVKKEKEYQVQDDGLGRRLFVYMKGTTDNPEYGIDKEVAKETRQMERQAEKENVKALLKEEFGMFKKSNEVGTYKEKATSKQTTTTIEWDEGDKPQTSKQEAVQPHSKPNNQTQEQTDKPKKKTPKWLQERE